MTALCCHAQVGELCLQPHWIERESLCYLYLSVDLLFVQNTTEWWKCNSPSSTYKSAFLLWQKFSIGKNIFVSSPVCMVPEVQETLKFLCLLIWLWNRVQSYTSLLYFKLLYILWKSSIVYKTTAGLKWFFLRRYTG